MRKKTLILLSVFLACLLVRVTFLLFTHPEQYVFDDMRYADDRAMGLVNHRMPSDSTLWPPFYYIFLASVYSVFKLLGLLGMRYFLVALLQMLLFAAAAVLIYLIVERLASPAAALVASIIYIVFYPLIYLNVFLLSENLFFPLLVAILSIIIFKLESRWWWAVLGLLMGMAAVARPIFLPFIPLFVLWCWYYCRKAVGKKAGAAFWPNMALLLACFFAVLVFQAGFNAVISNGEEHSFSSNGGFNFAIAWCDLKGIEFRDGGRWWRFYPPGNSGYPADRMITTSVPFTNQAYYYRMGLACIRQHPVQILENLKNIGRLFHSSIAPWYSTIPGWRSLNYGFDLVTFIVLLPFSFVACAFIDKRDRKYLVLFGLLILSLFAAVYLQAPGERRYLVPYDVIFIILGSIGIAGALAWSRRRLRHSALLQRIRRTRRGVRWPTPQRR